MGYSNPVSGTLHLAVVNALQSTLFPLRKPNGYLIPRITIVRSATSFRFSVGESGPSFAEDHIRLDLFRISTE